jgi:hypothetical protein
MLLSVRPLPCCGYAVLRADRAAQPGAHCGRVWCADGTRWAGWHCGGLRAHDSRQRGRVAAAVVPPACPDHAVVLKLTVLFGQASQASEAIARTTSS